MQWPNDKGQTIQWPSDKGQTMQWRNDKRQTMQWRNDKGQTMQWRNDKGQTMQWPNDKGQTNNDIQNITHKTKDRVTRTGGERRRSGRVCSSCSTSDTRHFTLITNLMISHE